MNSLPSRRRFLASLGLATAAMAIARPSLAAASDPPYKISLAQWSLHRAIRNKTVDHLDFAKVARQEFDIDAVEYVNQFFKDKAKDESFLGDMKKRAADHGVTSLLIMIDGEGQIGAPDEAARVKTVDNHKKWVDAAKFLGCHSVRVNAGSSGSFEEQQKLAADGLRRLSEYAATEGLNVLVENHGGLSSHGAWLAGVMKLVGMDNCGTLPDFGNFVIRRGDLPLEYDRYLGVDELMPFAKAVSAKSHDFDESGNETATDFRRMMRIVLSHGYDGYVGIEYEGGRLSEMDGIRKTKELLQRLQTELAG
ncbi:MAG: sugar phosphate isomerase/epimerase [Planctomycetaceae bacterium]|nr:MAG: sugar phosphate isomerase/epimerase [Planctomycetaceae bacterium]